MRLQGYRARVAQEEEKNWGHDDFHLESKGHVVNLCQNVEFYDMQFHGCVPALLRQGLYWSLSKDRPFTPLEHLLVMGIRVYDSGPRNPLEKFLLETAPGPSSGRRLKEAAGNSMHVPTIGLLMLYIFATWERESGT